jgi:hypothetical protein
VIRFEDVQREKLRTILWEARAFWVNPGRKIKKGYGFYSVAFYYHGSGERI